MLAAIGYGTLPTLARYAAEAGISTVAFVTWRSLLGATILALAVAVLTRAGHLPRLHLRSLSTLHRTQVVSVALMTVLTNLALFTAFERASVAVALICFYTFPVMVALAAVRVYDEPLTPPRLGALALASVGMLLMVLAPAAGQEGVVVAPIGIVLGLAGAVSQAIYALIAGRGYPSLTSGQAAMTITSVAAIGYVLVAMLGGSVAALAAPFQTGGWTWLAAGALIGLAIPTAAVLAGFRQLGPTRTSILMLLEPMVSVLLAALFLAERPSPLQLAGGLMVLAGGAMAQLPWQRPGVETAQESVPQAEVELR